MGDVYKDRIQLMKLKPTLQITVSNRLKEDEKSMINLRNMEEPICFTPKQARRINNIRRIVNAVPDEAVLYL